MEYALAVMELHERQNVVNHYLLSQSNTEYEYPDVEDYWKESRSLDFRDTNAYNCWLRKQSFINAGPLGMVRLSCRISTNMEFDIV